MYYLFPFFIKCNQRLEVIFALLTFGSVYSGPNCWYMHHCSRSRRSRKIPTSEFNDLEVLLHYFAHTPIQFELARNTYLSSTIWISLGEFASMSLHYQKVLKNVIFWMQNVYNTIVIYFITFCYVKRDNLSKNHTRFFEDSPL